MPDANSECEINVGTFKEEDFADDNGQTSGGAPRSRACGACEAPPHKD